jgi:uncharacterized protein YbjT (DUF2867 family)/tryptophan-rich sensory protein
MTSHLAPTGGPVSDSPAGADTPPTRTSTHTSTHPSGRGLALVTGATGYIGAALVPALLATRPVRVLVRDPAGLRGRTWATEVDVVVGDAGNDDDLRRALDGVEVAYYLVHSMDGGDFAQRDRELATSFARLAGEAGVSRIVYLGGLHPEDGDLSAHLASRAETGRILLDGPVPAACLQAAVVLGAGSASFDMLRYLTGRLPVMITPRWIDNAVQPIAAEDAVRCLVAAANLPPEVNRAFDIGGPDVVRYRELMQRYAVVAGLRPRRILAVPVLTPWLASHWVGAVTPVPAALAKPLVLSLAHPVVRRERDFDTYLQDPRGIGVDAALARAHAESPPDTGPANLARTAGAVAACVAVGGLATRPDSRWYQALAKPSWQPPPASFGLVWTPLYTIIATVSAQHLTALDRDGAREEGTAYRRALGVNLGLNALWSILFFRVRNLPLASAGAAALAASSADLARRASSTGRHRGLLLGGYAAWCTFATALTTDITHRNPDSGAPPARALGRALARAVGEVRAAVRARTGRAS